MKDHGMKAVNDGDASDGVLTWWELHGEVSATRFLDALQKAGLNESDLPNAPTDRVALKRALEASYRGAENVILRSAPDGAVSVVFESFVESDDGVQRPTYSRSFTAWIDSESDICFDSDVPEADAIALAFSRSLRTYTTLEISQWLMRAVRDARGLAVRDTGGVYFISAFHEVEWRRRVNVLENVSACRVSMVPVLRTSDAARAILDAVIREASKEADALREDLANPDLGARALHGRTKRCDEAVQRLGMFEALFDAKLSEMRATFGELEASLAAAALAREVQS